MFREKAGVDFPERLSDEGQVLEGQVRGLYPQTAMNS